MEGLHTPLRFIVHLGLREYCYNEAFSFREISTIRHSDHESGSIEQNEETLACFLFYMDSIHSEAMGYPDECFHTLGQ